MKRRDFAGAGVFLIGYRGSGKTSVGRLLAARWNCTFVDTDRCVVETAGKEIARIFAEDGEPRFRDLEAEVLDTLVHRAERGERLVVATGGGIVLRPRNVERMRAAGAIVWLRAPAEALGRRIAGDPNSSRDRPALAGASASEEVGAVLAARAPLYFDAADLVVDTEGLALEDVARRVAERLSSPQE